MSAAVARARSLAIASLPKSGMLLSACGSRKLAAPPAAPEALAPEEEDGYGALGAAGLAAGAALVLVDPVGVVLDGALADVVEALEPLPPHAARPATATTAHSNAPAYRDASRVDSANRLGLTFTAAGASLSPPQHPLSGNLLLIALAGRCRVLPLDLPLATRSLLLRLLRT